MISFLQVLRKSKPMSIQLLRPFFQGVMWSISNLNAILQQETYIEQSGHVPDVPRKLCQQFKIKQQSDRRKILSVKLVFLSSGVQTGAKFPGQLLKNKRPWYILEHCLRYASY